MPSKGPRERTGMRPVVPIRAGWVMLADGTYALKSPPPKKHSPPVLPWMQPELSRSDRVIVFCESFRITSGPDVGKLFVMREWQRSFIRDVYREVDGVRPVRTAFLTMGRKNGKTALAALLALCHRCRAGRTSGRGG